MNVLIDLDGTLTDPAEGIIASLRHALAAMGHRSPEDRELKRFVGPPLQESFAELLGSGDPATIAAAVGHYRERYSAKGMFENSVYPEIPSALAALQALGASLFVATSKPTVYAERSAERFDLGRYFKAIYGSELDGARSNKTELIAHLLTAEALSAGSTCMVGDRSHDVIAARANGVFPVGVLWGYGSRHELVAAGASALCERPGELSRALQFSS